MAKHKHADLIKAWADGAQIQLRHGPTGNWISDDMPIWHTGVEYRIKPEPELSLPYRLCLRRGINGAAVGCARYSTGESDRALVEAVWEGMPEFIRWVSDWKQEEV